MTVIALPVAVASVSWLPAEHPAAYAPPPSDPGGKGPRHSLSCHSDGSVQDYGDSSELALELPQSCNDLSI